MENAFDKQLNKVCTALHERYVGELQEANSATLTQDGQAASLHQGRSEGFSSAANLIKPLINNPILMTFDHKDGFKLEDLLSLIVEEVKIKNGKLASADLPEGDKLIYESSNLTVITLLTIAHAIQKEAIELVHGGLDEDEKNARAEQLIALNAAVVSPFEDLGE